MLLKATTPTPQPPQPAEPRRTQQARQAGGLLPQSWNCAECVRMMMDVRASSSVPSPTTSLCRAKGYPDAVPKQCACGNKLRRFALS